jgi:hypothetical protein
MTSFEQRLKEDQEFAGRVRLNAYLVQERSAWRWDREWIVIGNNLGKAQFMRYPL